MVLPPQARKEAAEAPSERSCSEPDLSDEVSNPSLETPSPREQGCAPSAPLEASPTAKAPLTGHALLASIWPQGTWGAKTTTADTVTANCKLYTTLLASCKPSFLCPY